MSIFICHDMRPNCHECGQAKAEPGHGRCICGPCAAFAREASLAPGETLAFLMLFFGFDPAIPDD